MDMTKIFILHTRWLILYIYFCINIKYFIANTFHLGFCLYIIILQGQGSHKYLLQTIKFSMQHLKLARPLRYDQIMKNINDIVFQCLIQTIKENDKNHSHGDKFSNIIWLVKTEPNQCNFLIAFEDNSILNFNVFLKSQ